MALGRKKTRRKLQEQCMTDLPPDPTASCIPFTYVGLDVFGPMSITTQCTRGGHAESKQWAILFCCMCSRTLHIEIIDSMVTSRCISAIKHFFARSGPAKQLRSDCGTNFIGACKNLGMSKDEPYGSMQRFLNQQGCTWVFKSSPASYMRDSWECLIGVA